MLDRCVMLLERLDRRELAPTCRALRIGRCCQTGFLALLRNLRLQRPSMSAAFHVCNQRMDVFKKDVAITTFEFRGMPCARAMNVPQVPAREGNVAFCAEAMSSSDNIVLKDVQSFTYLAAMLATTYLPIVWWGGWIMACSCALMRSEVPSGSAMLL